MQPVEPKGQIAVQSRLNTPRPSSLVYQQRQKPQLLAALEAATTSTPQ
jgi:hypothetical protein